MLIRITNACTMGCPHCMVNATPDGAHMTLDTFKATLAFAHDVDPYGGLLVSGGEPTDHPQVVEFLQLAQEASCAVTLLSNGLFLANKSLLMQVLSRVARIQVTDDPRFYPKRIERVRHPRITYEDTLRQLAPFGRAKDVGCDAHGLPRQMYPSCFNLRSATRADGDVRRGLVRLRMMQRFCVPSVNVDGTVVAGEAPSCWPIGTVHDSALVITRNILAMPCQRCGLVKNLNAAQCAAVGLEMPDGG